MAVLFAPFRGVGETAGLALGDAEGELCELLIDGGIRSLILSSFFASSNDWILWPGSKPCSAVNAFMLRSWFEMAA